MKQQVNLLFMTAVVTLASACGTATHEATSSADVIGRSDIRIEGRRMTPEALWAMGRIGGVCP